MIHSCSYHCHIPECIKAQREELRDKLFNREWAGLTPDEINEGLLSTHYTFRSATAWRDGVNWAMSQLKEKNT